ncbi:MAG: hypothetical protein KA368_12445 [Acidobacteria bacterium]|nr:hypothetical protein [Acidobacteriota bacterium]
MRDVVVRSREYQLDPNRLFKTDQEFDLTVVAVKEKPLNGKPWIAVAPAFPGVDEVAIIIQRDSDMLPSSSGSPILDDKFRLIGVHQSEVLETSLTQKSPQSRHTRECRD